MPDTLATALLSDYLGKRDYLGKAPMTVQVRSGRRSQNRGIRHELCEFG
jgi:hypothetical protein